MTLLKKDPYDWVKFTDKELEILNKIENWDWYDMTEPMVASFKYKSIPDVYTEFQLILHPKIYSIEVRKFDKCDYLGEKVEYLRTKDFKIPCDVKEWIWEQFPLLNGIEPNEDNKGKTFEVGKIYRAYDQRPRSELRPWGSTDKYFECVERNPDGKVKFRECTNDVKHGDGKILIRTPLDGWKDSDERVVIHQSDIRTIGNRGCVLYARDVQE